ncbi:hypothetical protein BCD67_20020 [Oscillatoriales cyanobacterium USR001]|nr:hypothetical protein BCD67_20020 [Oscillatoriales cyanobacterium USR001]
MNLGIATAFAYGILTFVGGLIGYAKAQSKASLISGSVSGLLLILSGILQFQGQQSAGLILGVVVATVLVIVFISRLIKTRKMMPAALMIGGGIVAFALLVYQLMAIAEPIV